MRLEWIEDILAVLDSGSLVRAAEQRFVTQSAFTRRVRMIEESLGVELFDRRRKPITLLPGIATLEPELRDLGARLRKLRQELRMSAGMSGRPVTFVCQHAITATVSPAIVRLLADINEDGVRVRSANLDECLMQLLANEVDFAVSYEATGTPVITPPESFDTVTLASDRLIPVCTPRIQPLASGSDVPVIGYPSDVFLGRVFDQMISPQLPAGLHLVTKAETALTLAMQQLVMSDIGVAWLPETLVSSHLKTGHLVSVETMLPSQKLDVKMMRVKDRSTARSEAIWAHIVDRFEPQSLA